MDSFFINQQRTVSSVQEMILTETFNLTAS